MKASGKDGDLRYRYQVAATFRAWALEPVVGTSGHRFRLLVDLLTVVSPWCDYRPLELRLRMSDSQWLWTNLDPDRISLPTLGIELHDPPTITKENRHG